MHCNYPLEQSLKHQDDTDSVEEAAATYRKHENTVADKQDVHVQAGWLVQHVPGKDAITYDLPVGKNVIGRPTDHNDVDIPIEDDPYISRKHAVIAVSKGENGQLQAVIRDDGSENQGKPSTNGTFINAKSTRLPVGSSHTLQHGDAIQVGETVLIYRSIYQDMTPAEAATEVINTDFVKTIPINV